MSGFHRAAEQSPGPYSRMPCRGSRRGRSGLWGTRPLAPSRAAATPRHVVSGCNGFPEHWICGPREAPARPGSRQRRASHAGEPGVPGHRFRRPPQGRQRAGQLPAEPAGDSAAADRGRAASITRLPGAPEPSQRPIVGHCPSGAGWAPTPTATSSSRPFRTAQITSSCFVPMPSLSCMR